MKITIPAHLIRFVETCVPKNNVSAICAAQLTSDWLTKYRPYVVTVDTTLVKVEPGHFPHEFMTYDWVLPQQIRGVAPCYPVISKP